MKRLVSLGVAVALAFVTASAGAYCRTMSCKEGECPRDDQGCPTSGVVAVWAQTMPLTFRFHARGTALLVNEEARAAIRAAFFRWTDVICEGGRTSLRFVEGEDLTEDKPLTVSGRVTGSVAPFGIYFRDTGWPHPVKDGDGMLALTTLSVGQETGRITYADIEINTGGYRLATGDLADGQDLQSLVTHEVGHYIGLAHSVAANSIMNPSLCDKGERCQVDKVAARRLGDDDLAAVCALYPPGASAPPPPKAAPADPGGCASSTSPRSGPPMLGFAALGLLIAARRARAAHRMSLRAPR